MCYQVLQVTIMMFCTCTEVIFSGKPIMNFLTNVVAPTRLHEAASEDVTMEGDGSPKTTHGVDARPSPPLIQCQPL